MPPVNLKQHVGQREATVSRLFEAVNEALKDLPETDRDQFKSQVVDPLHDMANLPTEQQKSPTISERAQALFARISPFAPTINKAVLAFGEASLTALDSSNPIISGLLAAIKSLKA